MQFLAVLLGFKLYDYALDHHFTYTAYVKFEKLILQSAESGGSEALKKKKKKDRGAVCRLTVVCHIRRAVELA